MENFSCKLWPEDPTPRQQLDCKKCGLYKHGSRMVWGEGNPKAPIMIILDNPGLREDKDGNAFVCGTRQTLQSAAHQVQLLPEDLYVTYILKRKPTRKYEKEHTRSICVHHLEAQLSKQEPSALFCLGNVSVQTMFEHETATVKDLRGKWHEVQGIPTAVAYHPLAVRRRPNLWTSFLEDWQLLASKMDKI